MFRVAFILVATLAVTVGLLVGTLNSDIASLDLLWIRLSWPLGLIVLGAAAVGMLLGLALAYFFSVLPLRARLKRAARNNSLGTSGSLKQLHD